MAAQVEVQSGEAGRNVGGGHLYLSPLADSSNSLTEIPSISQSTHITPESSKPIPGPKPRLTPKPYAVDRNPTIKPIVAPKPRPESTRLPGHKPEPPYFPKPQQPAGKPVSADPNRPEEQEKTKPEAAAVPLRPQPRGSRPRPVSAFFLDSPAKTGTPVPAARWAGRRPLSADLTSKFESIGLSLHRNASKCVAKPADSDQKTVVEKRAGSIKSRISLLLDSSSTPAALGQASDLHSPVQPAPEAEPAVGVKKLIKQLTEDTTPTQSPTPKPSLKPRPLPLDLTKSQTSRGPDEESMMRSALDAQVTEEMMEVEKKREQTERHKAKMKELERERLRQLEMEKEALSEFERKKEKELQRQKALEREKQEFEEKQHALVRQRQLELKKLQELEGLRQLEKEKRRKMERERQQELERQRQKEEERQSELDKERQLLEIQKEKQRLEELERQKQKEMERQQLMELEKQRLREKKEREEAERLKQMALEQEVLRIKEIEKEMERQRQRDLERERQRQLDMERQRQLDMERQRQLDMERQELEKQRLKQREQEKERQRREELERIKEMEKKKLLEFAKQKQAERDREQEKRRLREEAENMRQVAKQQEAERQRLKERQKKKEERERARLESSALRPTVVDLDSVLRNEPIPKAMPQRADPATRWREPTDYKPAILDVDTFSAQTQFSPCEDLFPVSDGGFAARPLLPPERDISWKVPSVSSSSPAWILSPQDPWELQPVEMSVDSHAVEPRKHANKLSPDQLLHRQEERLLAPQRHWSSMLDQPLLPAAFPGTEARSGVPAGGVLLGRPQAGGVLPGGPPSGGVLPGGHYTGWDLPGGLPTGGSPVGGVLPGGPPTGGVLPGGPSTGGVLPGGPSTGGVLPGGVSSGTAAEQIWIPREPQPQDSWGQVQGHRRSQGSHVSQTERVVLYFRDQTQCWRPQVQSGVQILFKPPN
uniref:Uncharacterized protein n=1 Tax=Mola mola TaxID=94237 RepID=A0A3Q3WG18_MOLML